MSMKNETNIMVKNVVDVVLGGFTYWLFGYSLSFGESEWTNAFCGWGSFAINPGEDEMGRVYTTFFFQLSFATTATTIVSGAIAERSVQQLGKKHAPICRLHTHRRTQFSEVTSSA